MKSLEQLAKELFIRFSLQETGIEARWEYLNKNRKAVWMKDVILVADHVLLHLKDQVKPVIFNKNINTSFSMGYNAGLTEERVMFITLLDNYHNQLLAELKEFLEEVEGVQT